VNILVVSGIKTEEFIGFIGFVLKEVIIFLGRLVLERRSIYRKKATKQSHIRFGKYAILFLNTN
jgi:hypothetical protein